MTLHGLGPNELRRRLLGSGLQFRCGPLVAHVSTSLRDLAEPIALLYHDAPLADAKEIRDFAVRVESHGPLGAVRRRAVALVDGRPVFDPFPIRHALPMFEWAINYCVFTRPNQYLLLHAGVVERGGHALLLPGQPGAGKTTITAGLTLNGWRLLSDEVGMVPPGTRNLLPVPRPLSLKGESIDIIRRFSSEAVIGPPAEGTKKGTVAHMRPPSESVARATEPAVPRWIVFPRFEGGAAAELRRVSRADALLRVGREAFNYSLLGAAGFETLADLVEGCDCYELTFGELGEALECLGELTG
jgi:HprK-related kinase A